MSKSYNSSFDFLTVRPFSQVTSASSEVQTAVSNLQIPTSQWATVVSFVVGDVVGLLSVFGAILFVTKRVLPQYALQVVQWISPLVLFIVVGFALAGLYRRRFTHPALEMQRIGAVTGGMGFTAALTVYLTAGAEAFAGLIVAGTLLAAVTMPICRTLFRILLARTAWWGLPAVVIGTGGNGATILHTLHRWPEIGVRPVALLTDTVDQDPGDVPITGGYELAPYLAQRFKIPYAIIAMPGLTHEERARLLMQYTKFFDHVFVVGSPAGSPALWTTGRSGEGLFGYGVRHVALQPGARFIKRSVDVVTAGLAVVALAPLMALIALFIRRDSEGAVFYRQERMGLEGRIFTVLKFRTMYADADQKLADILRTDPARRQEYEQYHKLQNDPRVTRVGRVLRRFSLDELPQLFNVLRGEMSLVGPRAYMPSELSEMNGLGQAVLQTPPGVTGLWQVSGRNHVSFADRVNLDVHYIQNWSPWLDLYLLVRTIPVVLSGEGAS